MDETDYTKENENQQLRDALRLPLLFHKGGEWKAEDKELWFDITKSTEATTKVMCDHIRKVLFG